jgi:hypothetical protein
LGFFVCVCGTGVWTTPWATPPALFFHGFFRDRDPQTICTGWLWTMILLISASGLGLQVWFTGTWLEKLKLPGPQNVTFLCKFIFLNNFYVFSQGKRRHKQQHGTVTVACFAELTMHLWDHST